MGNCKSQTSPEYPIATTDSNHGIEGAYKISPQADKMYNGCEILYEFLIIRGVQSDLNSLEVYNVSRDNVMVCDENTESCTCSLNNNNLSLNIVHAHKLPNVNRYKIIFTSTVFYIYLSGDNVLALENDVGNVLTFQRVAQFTTF